MARLDWHPQQFLKKLDVTLADKLEKSATLLMYHVQNEAPFQTGTLRKSIYQKTDRPNLTAIVASNCEYAWFVEMGTRFMTPRAFFRKALTYSIPQIKRIFNKPLAMIGGIDRTGR